MILCLDVGNSHIYAGIFEDNKLLLRFRTASVAHHSSDQYGVFFRNVLRENQLDYKAIKNIALCSVVPQIDYSLSSACRKYFGITPFILQSGVKTGLKIRYRNPIEVGADRIANAIAATKLYPNRPIIVVDFGTATTLCAISKDKDYLGGVILAGMKLSMNALQSQTAKLSSVAIVKPSSVLGRSAAESIQSGLYFGQLNAIRSIIEKIKAEHFAEDADKLVCIGTGGFAYLFAEEQLFDLIEPDLVLKGLKSSFLANQNYPKPTKQQTATQANSLTHKEASEHYDNGL